MAWFKGDLYVGTTRANLCLLNLHDPARLAPWPTNCPPDAYDLDLRAQIWRYDFRADRWARVFHAPLVTGPDGRTVPREYGYRGIAVFQSPSDSHDALYISNWAAGRAARPPLIIRSPDGATFRALPSIGEDPAVLSYRALVALNGHLYTSPTGRTMGRPNVSQEATVLKCEDPVALPWSSVSAPGFGDSTNLTVFEMVPFRGALYAGTLNPVRGFEIWKAWADGYGPYRWVKVLDNGAYRGNLNEGACSMCVFNDALYVGTAIQHGGYDKSNKVGPAAAELIRIHPDDTWDLVMGSARLTPAGFKVPLSGRGPGFDDFFNCYVWRMAVHDGWLYAGTFNWRPYLPYLNLEKWPAHVRDLVFGLGVNSAMDGEGGFQLWRSGDGVSWLPITLNGFGNPYNCGARTMVSTPQGLCVGTANPFGPEVAVKTRSGWEYVPNPGGGLEVWLAPKNNGATPGGWTVGTRSGTSGRASRPVGPYAEQFIKSINQTDDDRMYAALIDEYYGYGDFLNLGLWYPDTTSQKEASENLVEALIAYIPSKTGRILDVACGKGATTRCLLGYYTPANVTGINISEEQLQSCRQNAPGCDFRLMDATNRRLPDGSFDAVICVESAFHFNSRAQFFREAHRVLKPNGRLVLSDILVGPLAERLNPLRSVENYLSDLDSYGAALAAAGFKEHGVFDTTAECKVAYYRNLFHHLEQKYCRREIDEHSYVRLIDRNLRASASMRMYLLAWARKV
jgi:SAM-dependent methyltransferase